MCKCGGGHYKCESCGAIVFGSSLHFCDKNKPKGKEMELVTEKIQMTEEEADKLITNVFLTFFDISEISLELKNRIKEKMRKEGFIKKSELETLVEEAEEMWDGYKHRFSSLNPENKCQMIEHYYETIQALIKDHPEFKL